MLSSSLIESGALMSLDRDFLLIGYGPYQRLQNRRHLDPRYPAFYFPDFFLHDSYPWFQYANWCEVKIKEVEQELKGPFDSSALEWSTPHQNLFQQAFVQLQQDFAVGKLQKAVPYAFTYSPAKMTPSRWQNSLKKALNYIRNYSGYLYGFWHHHEGLLGVTPEILFQCHQPYRLQTVALAGTCSQQSCQAAFKCDAKQLHEHQVVIEDIKSSLQKFGTVHIGELQILSLPVLSHLMTPIEVELSISADFEEIVQALHPTPAIGAFPSEKGALWLREYQKQLDRGRYGAPAGFIYPQQEKIQCLVAIRHVQWDERGMRIGAGCGVVKESQYKQEWKEINLKMDAIRDLLSL